MSQPVIFPNESLSACVASEWLDGTMSIHVCCVVGLTYKRTRTHSALEGLCAAICVRPMVLLKIPLCAEHLVADRTRVLLVGELMRRHVSFDARW